MVLFLLKGFLLLLLLFFFCFFFFFFGGGGVVFVFFMFQKKVPEYKCLKDLHKIVVLIHFQPL